MSVSKGSEKGDNRGRRGSRSGRDAGVAPDHARAVADYEAAMKLFARQDFARARDIFRSIPERYPLEAQLGDLARSRAAICERRAHHGAPRPNGPEDHCNLGVFLLNEGNDDSALEQFRKAAESGGGGQAWYLMACSLVRMGRSGEALDALKKAVELDPLNRARASNEEDFEPLRGEAFWISLIGASTGEEE